MLIPLTLERYTCTLSILYLLENCVRSLAFVWWLQIDRAVREENQSFYSRCLDYVLCVQEFEERWLHFFAESVCLHFNMLFSYSFTCFQKYFEYLLILILPFRYSPTSRVGPRSITRATTSTPTANIDSSERTAAFKRSATTSTMSRYDRASLSLTFYG